MSILFGLLAVIIVLAIAYAMSNDRKNVNFIGIGVMLLAQVLTTWFMFMTPIGEAVINFISDIFNKLIEFGTEGVNFVLGGVTVEENASVFFFNVLLIIIFFSTILSVLTYLKVLPFIIKYLGWGNF
ncbi:nucleoside permease NupC [Gracilibacillus boraciitolerans JCM 21714]|uniref:Nucleoside permease NupC n=1 Tax=Gracilibacillus boraciitolerans JCM 21714 TaxID=1298598 RepID=W4VKL9_9BACI|nr:nucleoside permease NupC [Gracilibacillus boraciitolerans JCM 21714]